MSANTIHHATYATQNDPASALEVIELAVRDALALAGDKALLGTLRVQVVNARDLGPEGFYVQAEASVEAQGDDSLVFDGPVVVP